MRPHHPTRTAALAVAAAAALLVGATPVVASEGATAPAVTTDDAPDEQRPDGVVVEGPTLPELDSSAAATAGSTDEPVVLLGRGNGHGIGMSQYGARGGALAGRSAGQIISRYYTGASVGTAGAPFDPRIGVAGDQTRVRLVVRGGDARVDVGGTVARSGPGDAWTVRMLATGRCAVTLNPAGADTPSEEEVRFDPGAGTCVSADPIADGQDTRIDVKVLTSDGYRTVGQYGREAVVEVVPDAVSGTWRLDAVVELPLEQYLYGLAEVPYSWEQPALRSQAIAGRSYALWRLKDLGPSPDRGCSCHLYDSQRDQVYRGWERESSAQWSSWKQAVDATAGRVVLAPGAIDTRDGVVQAFYSSASNGRTEAKHELWGGAPYPYLVSVDDPWTLDPATGNPFISWTKEVAPSTVAAALGLDEVTAARVTGRSTSGATTEVVFSGLDGGAPRDVAVSGSWMRSAFGLRSTTFDVRVPAPPSPSPSPSPGPPNPIEDVPFTDIDGSVHAGDIAWLWAWGYTTGCNAAQTLYCPDRSVTRGQMAAFIKRAWDLPPGTRVFSDTRGHLFEQDIAALADAGITSGCGKDEFCPDRAVTRAEMAAFIQRAEGLRSITPTSFADARGHLHEGAIEAIRRAGITKGCNPPDNSRFCPDSDVTRAQMASFIRRALEG